MSGIMQKKWTIEHLQEIAEKHSGKCLSKRYLGTKFKHKFQCKNGHVWEAVAGSIIAGTWCRECHAPKKLSIKVATEEASKFDGFCLSRSYKNARSPLKWKCSQGHVWQASLGSVRAGHWCKTCSMGFGEEICRQYFEQLFDDKFPKRRPLWLVNKRGNKMELDGYSEKCGIAFEYHGRQHFQVGYYTKNISQLQRRREDDKTRRELCKKRNILLIEVPEIGRYVELGKLEKYIRNRALAGGKFPVSQNVQIEPKTKSLRNWTRELSEIAESKQGKLLSKSFLGWHENLTWMCQEGHSWDATPANIKQGNWCAVCANRARKSISEMSLLAKKYGGKCLSKNYKNNRKKLKWECEHGHMWSASSKDIRRGRWCGECKKIEDHRQRSVRYLEELKVIAKERKGFLLSEHYINTKTHLSWECHLGHKWEAVPSSVKAGRWCPICARKKQADSLRGTLNELKEIAKKRNGKCLSKNYKNQNSPVKWECHLGHKWDAVPSSVKAGTWCPICGRKKQADSLRGTLNELKEIAKKRNGKCLSKIYKNQNSHVKWECHLGHKWEAVPSSVKAGKWCPICARKKQADSLRGTGEELKVIARKRKGK